MSSLRISGEIVTDLFQDTTFGHSCCRRDHESGLYFGNLMKNAGVRAKFFLDFKIVSCHNRYTISIPRKEIAFVKASFLMYLLSCHRNCPVIP